MADFKPFKVVASLPSTLEPDALYLVRVGAGFDLYATNGVGEVSAYKLNTPEVTGLVEDSDPRLSDAREWTASTVSQAEAEAGTASTRRAWTAQRVRQAIAAWYSTVSTSFTRTLLGRSTAAQVRGDLELGTAATRSVGEASGNVMEVGAFGLGNDGSARLVRPTDIRGVTHSGMYQLSGRSGADYPLGGASSTLLQLNWENNTAVKTQIVHGLNNRVFVSAYGTTGWYPYQELIHTGNIQSTTGQSTDYPMTQKAVTDALATKAALNATATEQGGLKARLDGTTLYLTNNGTNP